MWCSSAKYGGLLQGLKLIAAVLYSRGRTSLVADVGCESTRHPPCICFLFDETSAHQLLASNLLLTCLPLLLFLHAAAAPAAAVALIAALTPVFPCRFFKERWRLPLCPAPEQLCRDFCLSLHHGRYLLLASASPQQQRQDNAAPAPAAAAAATARTAAAGRAQQQQQQLGPDVGGPGDDAGEVLSQHGQGVPSVDCCPVTTFHVVSW